MFRYSIPLLLMMLHVPTAHASTALITLNGRVLPGTCAISNASQTVTLDDIRIDQIATGINNAKSFTLNFNNCVGVNMAMLSFAGTTDPGDTQRWKNTVSSNAATGIALGLLEGTSGTQYLYPGLARPMVVSGTTATYSLRAGYYRRATGGAELKPGAVSGQITVSVTYQ